MIAGLVGENQNILWISDRDEIVPNDARHIEACRLFSHIISHYVSVTIGRLQFATTRSDDGSRRLEDIAALPDFAAGALADVVTSMLREGTVGVNGILSPMSRTLPRKSQALTAWLADNSYTLKKLAFVIEHIPPDGIKSKLLQLATNEPIAEYDPFPTLMRTLY